MYNLKTNICNFHFTMEKICFLFLFLFLLFIGCERKAPGMGIVDIQRVIKNWHKFQDYNNRLAEEKERFLRAINKDYLLKESIDEVEKRLNPKEREEFSRLKQKWQKWEDALTEEIRKAAQVVADQLKLNFVITSNGVEYGGVDITADILKELK